MICRPGKVRPPFSERIDGFARLPAVSGLAGDFYFSCASRDGVSESGPSEENLDDGDAAGSPFIGGNFTKIGDGCPWRRLMCPEWRK
jgi:hypothetical protein